MTSAQTFRPAVALVLFIALIATNGCEQSHDTPDQGAVATMTTAQPAAPPGGVNAPPSMDLEAINRRRSELQSEIETAQLQQGDLKLERERIVAQMAAHQKEGDEKLAALRAQFQALQQREAEERAKDPTQASRSRDQFAEAARNQLEDALALDQEYRNQLSEVDQKLSATDAQLRDLRTELGGLPTTQ